MHRLLELHAAALSAHAGKAPLPRPPSGFVTAWVEAAAAFLRPAEADRLRRDVAHDAPLAWIQRFHDAPSPIHELVRLDLRVAQVPRLRAALDGLFDGARRSGIDPADTWGCADADALLAAHPTVRDLHTRAFFGASQPMVSLGPAEQAALAGCALDPATLLEGRFAGHIVHELAHGPDRPWRGGPASWLLHEAAAAVVNLGCQPDHVLAARPGEAVLGLRAALVLGQAVLDHLGPEAVWRLALTARDAASQLGPRAANALTAAEWQAWVRAGGGPFRPRHDRVVSFARLLDVALSAPELIPALGALADREVVRPEDALVLPDLLDAADAIPSDRLPAWRRPLTDRDAEATHLAVASLFQVERLQPDVQACPADPPGGRLHLDVAAATLRAEVRADDAHGLPAVSRLPLPLCAALAASGHAHVQLEGCRFEDRAAIADHLLRRAGPRRPDPLRAGPARPAPAWPRPMAPGAVPVPPPTAQLHHADAVVTLGSCFAASLAERLSHGGFEVCANPFGILYDPLSVARAARWLDRDDPLPSDLLFRAHGRWHSPWHHTDLSHPDRDHAAAVMQQRLDEARAAWSRQGTTLLTWGTAWAWRRDGQPVANCHGLDGCEGALLTVEEIVSVWSPLLDQLAARRPTLRLVLTVSPIRHLAQGHAANTRSKATLHLAAAALAERHPNLDLFPAWEIVTDELRDHRWFEADGAHVTPAAADEVAERFFDAWLAPAARARARALRALRRRLVETPRDPHRRLHALDGMLRDLDALPATATTPPPGLLRVQVQAARDVARALMDGDPSPPAPPPPATPPRVPPTPPPRVPSAAPLIAPRDLADWTTALAPGRWIDWEALPGWLAEVAAVAVRGAEAWPALDAALAKADELEDPTRIQSVIDPLLPHLLGPDGPAGGVHALADRLLEALPRGLVDPAGLARLSPPDRAALAALLAARDRPHPAILEALAALAGDGSPPPCLPASDL